MALIQCPECRNTVSETAAACPHCGAPVAPPVATIQETGKGLKLEILLAAICCLTGGIWIIVAYKTSTASADSIAFAVSLLVVGALWYFVTKIRIWWHHK